jgi:ethanolamine utilization protein EutA
MTASRSEQAVETASSDHGPVVDVAELSSEVVRLTSVGVDVGSATVHVVCSRLELRRRSASLSSEFEVVSRRVVWASEPAFTPYAADDSIDAAAVTALVAGAFHRAGADPSQVDTGAVILTGEAVRRRNARAIAQSLSANVGHFVSATAGHRLEAVLAAQGSGAVALSRRTGARVLHVDIGGGTTKLVDIDAGRVRATAAVHVGGRLAVVSDGVLVRLEPVAADIAAAACGAAWRLGCQVSSDELRRTAELFADVVVATAMGGGRTPPGHENLQLVEPLTPWAPGDICAVTFSGGVAAFVHGHEERDFGDLGQALGRAVRERLDAAGTWPIVPLPEGIRATVLGASQHSGQVSGSTVHAGTGAGLPLQDLRVVVADVPPNQDVDTLAFTRAVVAELGDAGLQEGEDRLALALRWAGPPSHGRLRAVAEGVLRALPRTVASGRPVVVLVDSDLARALGVLLERELGCTAPVVTLDGVAVSDLDHIDISAPLGNGAFLVTVKSLVFAL